MIIFIKRTALIIITGVGSLLRMITVSITLQLNIKSAALINMTGVGSTLSTINVKNASVNDAEHSLNKYRRR